MPSSANLEKRLLARIRASSEQLTVHFPAARPTVTDTSPGPAPTNPLFGTAPVQGIAQAPTPAKPPVTMPCLWQEAGVQGDLRRNPAEDSGYAWYRDAEAMVRVTATDATAGMSKGTVFDGALAVEHQGRRYTVIATVPMGAAFSPPHSYTVWLKGAPRQ